MANRRPRRLAGPNQIRGPHSALTDYLASHNISAQQISSEHQRRLREAQEQQGTENSTEAQNAEDKENESNSEDEDPAERKKRKRKEEKAIMKIKQSKEFKRRKSQRNPEDSGSEYGDDDDAIARKMLQKSVPMAGQLENCDICEKRFTVTPYSKTGPNAGLLCAKCGKSFKEEEEKKAKAEAKKRKGPTKLRRRQTESDRMMGDVKPGVKSLVDLCVRRVADVVNDVESFGDIPQSLLDRLSQILSKKRVMTPRILELFLTSGNDRIAIYDCGKLEQEDFHKIFSSLPDLENVNLRFAGQLKDDALNYMAKKNRKLKHLQLGATNLVTDNAWMELFVHQGAHLESLKLSELNDSLTDDAVAMLSVHCTNLRRIKLRKCSHMTETSMESLAALSTLEHLSLAVCQDSSPEAIVKLISTLGSNLRTLSIEDFIYADDTVIEAIHTNCSNLTKLRFTGNSICSNKAFTDLFTEWSNPALHFVDLSENRDVDSTNPGGQEKGEETEPIGFNSEAFKALMAHSGPALQCLDLHSCRHISHDALLEVFDGKQKYPMLKDIDLSFVACVDDVVMTGIFKSCPKLTKLAVFACFNARGTRIPAGIAVIGLPNAQDNIIVEGGES